MKNGNNKEQRPSGNVRIRFQTRALKFPLPSRMVHELAMKEIDDRKIRDAVTRALWILVYEKPLPPQMPGEHIGDYVRRITLESRGGVPPSLDEPLFVDGMTVREWFAMSEEERQALWDKWHEEAEEDVEREYGRGVDVRPKDSVRQKRREKNARRAYETRAGYRTKRSRKSRS